MSGLRYLPRPTHYVAGRLDDQDYIGGVAWCGRVASWHSGLAYTRRLERVTCRQCLKVIRRRADAPPA